MENLPEQMLIIKELAQRILKTAAIEMQPRKKNLNAIWANIKNI